MFRVDSNLFRTIHSCCVMVLTNAVRSVSDFFEPSTIWRSKLPSGCNCKSGHLKGFLMGKRPDEHNWNFTTSRIASPFLRQSRPVVNLFLISLGFAPLPGPACNILHIISSSIFIIQLLAYEKLRENHHIIHLAFTSHVFGAWPSWPSSIMTTITCFQA